MPEALMLPDDPDCYCFVDTETKALPHTAGTLDESVTNVGTHRYARNSRVIIVSWAIGLAPRQVYAVPDFIRHLAWSDLPEELRLFAIQAAGGEGWFVAWNAAFDRLQVSGIPGGREKPQLSPETFLDAMVQAAASNLPAKLEGASLSIGRHGKQADGKELIQLFCMAAGGTPQSHPVEWQRFIGYAGQDIDELRAVWFATRRLPRKEWREYWVNERINDRGMAVDIEFARRAAAVAELSAQRLSAQLAELTDRVVTAATQAKRIGEWLYQHIPYAEARDALVKTWGVDDDEATDDDEPIPTKLSVAEDRLETISTFFQQLDERQGLTDAEYAIWMVVEARLFGASSTPKKFEKMVRQSVLVEGSNSLGALMGQFTFNGAGQTGRFSSRGVQVHNLVRAALSDKDHPGRETAIIEAINELEID